MLKLHPWIDESLLKASVNLNKKAGQYLEKNPDFIHWDLLS
jgi:hypothetical protein